MSGHNLLNCNSSMARRRTQKARRRSKSKLSRKQRGGRWGRCLAAVQKEFDEWKDNFGRRGTPEFHEYPKYDQKAMLEEWQAKFNEARALDDAGYVC